MNITEITEKAISEKAVAALPPDLALHKLRFFYSKGNMRIAVELDKPSDKYGSANVGDCESFARTLGDSLEVYEKESGLELNYSLEVSSAGAERELSSVLEIQRFRELPLQATFVSEEGKVLTEVLVAHTIDGERIEFKMADCKTNRKKFGPQRLKRLPGYTLSWSQIKKIKLHLDI